MIIDNRGKIAKYDFGAREYDLVSESVMLGGEGVALVNKGLQLG